MGTKYLKQMSNGEIELTSFGLELTINPFNLLKETITPNAQAMLDQFVESQFKEVLHKFEDWHCKILDENPQKPGTNPNDYYNKTFDKYMYEVKAQEIQNVADVVRNLLPLHSDAECIELSLPEQESRDNAFYLFKYKEIYGFKNTREIQL